MVFLGNKKKVSRFSKENPSMKTIPIFSLAIIFLISFALFSFTLNYYFFQDDWFVLSWVKTQNPLSFFAFRTDIIYWRPISMPILFFLQNKLFSLNSVAFHLVSFLFFFTLIGAVYKLFTELIKSTKWALITALLYGTWSIHYISLSWISTTSYIIGPLLQTMSFYFLILANKPRLNRYHFVFFVLFSE
jgi:hypothetical protein